jgi:hypothetical protein
MMKLSNTYNRICVLGLITAAITWSSCKKDGNPNKLPDVSTASYAGKIDGFTSSDEIYPKNLVAYWSFDGTKNEKISGAAATSSANDAYVDGVKGQGISLNSGYVYYTNQFAAFGNAVFKSFTISTWVQILNNGSTKTMLFQLARPGNFTGSINFILETNSRAASVTNAITVHPTFTGSGGGTQDNLNTAVSPSPFLSPTIGATKWTHFVITFDAPSGVFQIWGDGIKIGTTAYQNRGANAFNAFEPSEVIIGGNYNVIPGKSVSTDASFAAMVGSMDELRVYNIALPDAYIKALYNLGIAKK